MILRGEKTIEVRSLSTRVRGTIYLYASKKDSSLPAALERAERMGIDTDSLPRGVLVGTVEIVGSRLCRADDAAAACVPPSLLDDRFAWLLSRPERFDEPLPVRFLPYGVWFYPFRRRNGRPGRMA